MKRWFRGQHGHYTFAEMQQYVSEDGGDDLGEVGGLCACDSVADLLANTVMDALDPSDEVIVFEGIKLADIYDGARVEPVREVARFTVSYFKEHADEIANEYQRWY